MVGLFQDETLRTVTEIATFLLQWRYLTKGKGMCYASLVFYDSILWFLWRAGGRNAG